MAGGGCSSPNAQINACAPALPRARAACRRRSIGCRSAIDQDNAPAPQLNRGALTRRTIAFGIICVCQTASSIKVAACIWVAPAQPTKVLFEAWFLRVPRPQNRSVRRITGADDTRIHHGMQVCACALLSGGTLLRWCARARAHRGSARGWGRWRAVGGRNMQRAFF